ncbi:MAG: hypothetical protein AB2L20_05705 [Mangrovibacterium sp.]
MAKIAFIVLSPTKQFKITIAKGESLSDILTHAALQNRELAAAIAEAAIELEYYNRADHVGGVLKRVTLLSRQLKK